MILEASGAPLHHATVLIIQLGRSVETDDEGNFVFTSVPPGSYDLVAHMHNLTDARRSTTVAPGGTSVVDFQLQVSPLRQEVTVTASGREETTLESFATVAALDSSEMTVRAAAPSLGEYLENQPGIAKRSFGPGNSRPVIRGFDGDRVLVLQDGVRTGTLSSQSGDHGEPVDGSALERVEVVRGPATLLYGSNAIGGVVNAITGHHVLDQHPHPGLTGHLTGIAGTNNGQGGGSGGFEFGHKNWILWGSGGGQRAGDYRSAQGLVPNSDSVLKHATGGFGRYGERTSFNFSYGAQEGDYGVPFASEFHGHGEEQNEGEAQEHEHEEPVAIAYRRHNLRFNGSVKQIGRGLDQFQLGLNYSDWHHRELEGPVTGTRFYNKQFVYRGVFEQAKLGSLSGRFGFWGMRRDFKAVGEEALAPPVIQDAFALFGLEELTFERLRVQLGGRYERNAYDAEGLRDRTFNGFSGSAGVSIPLWSGAAFVSSFSHSYRAPALEELYNRGPHVGNVTFEIGNSNLRRERSNGFEVSFRQVSSRMRAEANFFQYHLDDYIYLAPTGEFAGGLPIANYVQGGVRYMGGEGRFDFGLNQYLWLNLGVDAVDARLKHSDLPLPRIPPVRGRLGCDVRYKGFSLRPELLLADRQDEVYLNETETAGYALVNVQGTYTFARQHTMHVFGVNVFNASDRLYRNHLSFIKDYAAEMGRGVRFSYTLRWF